MIHTDSFRCRSIFTHGKNEYCYMDLKKAEENGLDNLSSLHYPAQIIVENMLRHEDGERITKEDIIQCVNFYTGKNTHRPNIILNPFRALLQDFTGVPVLTDLVSLQEKSSQIKIKKKMHLIIDHSIAIDYHGNHDSWIKNRRQEFQRNNERYTFLKWANKYIKHLTVIPTNMGICHQVNLEFLSECVVVEKNDDNQWIFPEFLIGTDSHTTMINALSILGWGVGGIEAEAFILGEGMTIPCPDIIEVSLHNKLLEGVTSTDLVLYIVEALRKFNVVNKIVLFSGPGVRSLSIEERGTISNMAPECGATCNLFHFDEQTEKYLIQTNRKSAAQRASQYMHLQDLYNCSEKIKKPDLTIDLNTIEPVIAGPDNPKEKIYISNVKTQLLATMEKNDCALIKKAISSEKKRSKNLNHGDIVIAAITSCTNTSNPKLLIGAGLLAKKAYQKGAQPIENIKKSFAPGSHVSIAYLQESGLQSYLDHLGFFISGVGCTTCIGNSGPLDKTIEDEIKKKELFVCSILSGNRNFQGRIHPYTKANFLMSPVLVVAYSLWGSMLKDIQKEPILAKEGDRIFLKDIWPKNSEIEEYQNKFLCKKIFKRTYHSIEHGCDLWNAIPEPNTEQYSWRKESTYIQKTNINRLGTTTNKYYPEYRILAILGDSITTDHISPAGHINKESDAGQYLLSRGVLEEDFNSYGSRRGNAEIMVRGTFANIRIKNKMDGISKEGGYTIHYPSKKMMTIYQAAKKYEEEEQKLVIFAGKEYGTGSSRDWAAKGTKLLGIQAVLAESFERIHRSNLIGLGVIPIQITNLQKKKIHLRGNEIVKIKLNEIQKIMEKIEIRIGGLSIEGIALIDSTREIEYIKNGSVFHYLTRKKTTPQSNTSSVQ